MGRDELKKNPLTDKEKPIILITLDGSGTTFDPVYIKEGLFPALFTFIEEKANLPKGTITENYKTFDPNKVFNTSFGRRAKKEFNAQNREHNFDFSFQEAWIEAKGVVRKAMSNKIEPVDRDAIREMFDTIEKHRNNAEIYVAFSSNLSPISRNGNEAPLTAQINQFFKQHDISPETVDLIMGAENEEQRKPNTYQAKRIYEELVLTGKEAHHIHVGDGYSDMRYSANLLLEGKNIQFILNNEESVSEYKASIANEGKNDDLPDIPPERQGNWVSTARTLAGRLKIAETPKELPKIVDSILSKILIQKDISSAR